MFQEGASSLVVPARAIRLIGHTERNNWTAVGINSGSNWRPKTNRLQDAIWRARVVLVGMLQYTSTVSRFVSRCLSLR